MFTLPAGNEDQLVRTLEHGFVIKRIGLRRVPEFTRLVFERFKREYGRRAPEAFTEEAYLSELNEELALAWNGLFFTVESSEGDVAATFRVIKYDSGLEFPGESVFGYSVPELAMERGVEPESFVHSDQFTLDIRMLRSCGIEFVRDMISHLLMITTFAVVEHCGVRYGIAETNPGVERMYETAGFRCEPITGYGEYWGKNRAVVIDLSPVITSPAYLRLLAPKIAAA